MERQQGKSIAGNLGYLGVAVSLFAALISSFMQKQLLSMSIAWLKYRNGKIRQAVRKDPVLIYLQLSKQERTSERIVVFSDAGFLHQGT
eukprot:IDg11014t1